MNTTPAISPEQEQRSRTVWDQLVEHPAVNAAAARMLTRPQTDPQVFRTLQDVLSAQEQRTRPRLVSIPASAALGANPTPTLANVLQLNICRRPATINAKSQKRAP
jgi:hypothetical protein